MEELANSPRLKMKTKLGLFHKEMRQVLLWIPLQEERLTFTEWCKVILTLRKNCNIKKGLILFRNEGLKATAGECGVINESDI